MRLFWQTVFPSFLWSVWSTWFIRLLWFNQTNETNQINQTDQSNQPVLTLHEIRPYSALDGSLCQKRLRADGAKRRCRVIRAGVYFRRWQGLDKICDSFTVSLTVPKKLYSEVTVFTPANHRYFHCQGDWLLSNSNLQCEIGACIQRDVAAHLATRGREVEQDPFSCTGIALDTGRVADWHSKATSWLHR